MPVMQAAAEPCEGLEAKRKHNVLSSVKARTLDRADHQLLLPG